MDCGPTCLRIACPAFAGVARSYGKHYTGETLRQLTGFSKQGVSLLGISETAEKIGFRTRGVQISFSQLQEIHLPAILHWNQNHFVVLIAISKKNAKIADPAKGIFSYTKKEFLSHWLSNKLRLLQLATFSAGVFFLLRPKSLYACG